MIPNAPSLASGQPAVGLGLAALGTVVCAGLITAGVFLYRSGFSTPNAVRIAVWNFLGLVVLGIDERTVISGDAEIIQLKHGSGLGLWVARSVAESAGGKLTFDTDGERTVVRPSHDRAASPATASEGPASTATSVTT